MALVPLPRDAASPAAEERGRASVRPRSSGAARDLISQLKRDRIVSAAVELFYSRGFANTTLDEVAQALGMTKPFIYQYFKSKNALLAEICSRAISDAHETLNRTLNQQGTAVEKLRIIVREFTLSVLNNQANAVIYSREETALAPADRARIVALRRDFDHHLAQLLNEGAETNEFVMDDVRLSAFAIASLVGWAPVWFRVNGRLSKSEAADGLAALALKMVGAKTP